jgi:hypothetical protein
VSFRVGTKGPGYIAGNVPVLLFGKYLLTVGGKYPTVTTGVKQSFDCKGALIASSETARENEQKKGPST